MIISNQQKGTRQIRSNTNVFVSYVPTRPPALNWQTTIATESGTTATTKHAIHTDFSKASSRGKKKPNNAIRWQMHATAGFLRGYCLLTTTFAWRSLTTGGTCIIQPSRSRGRSHWQCWCVAFPGAVVVISTTPSSFGYACSCHVCIHVLCTCTCRYPRNKCTSTMILTALPRGFFYSHLIFCFWTKYAASLEIMPCHVLFYQPLHTSRTEE